MDASISKDDEERIRTIIKKYDTELVDFHGLRTRSSGNQHHIDMHITVSKFRSLGDVHILCDIIETDIDSDFRDTIVLIHPEPCDAVCDKCRIKDYCPDAGRGNKGNPLQ